MRYKFNATAEQAPERDNTSSERRHVPNKHSTWEWVWECADEARLWQSWQRQRRVGERSTNRPPKLCTSGLTSAAAPSTYGVDYIEGMGKQGVYGVGIFTLPVTVALLLGQVEGFESLFLKF